MFCAPITLLHYFQEYKTGGLFCPPVKSLGGQKNPPVLCSISIFFNFYVIDHPHEGAFQNQYTPNPPSQLSLWEETGVPGENPRLSAER